MAKASAGKGAGKAKKGKGGAAAEGKKRRKKKAPRDPNRPKRATIAFMFFSNEQRPRVLRSSPQMHLSEVSKVLGAEWRGMDARAKAPYEAKAAADKKRYEREMAAYTPPFKPKRPRPAFMFFSVERRVVLQKQHKQLDFYEISKLLGAEWRQMGEADRAPYQTKADVDKLRYEQEMTQYEPPNWEATWRQ